MIVLKVDTSAVVKYTNQLEKLRRSALPSAIRGTLNKAAFNVKQQTMPASASKHFVNRKPNFFKANSRVNMAKGFDVNTMKSAVGFTSHNAKYNNRAVHELEQQEHGGKIGKRSFIPMESSRSGNSSSKEVLPTNRLRAIKNIINSEHVQGSSNRQKFVRAALMAGNKGYVIGNLRNRTLFKIISVKKVKGRTIINKRPLYSFKQNRSVSIKPTRFMREASYKTRTQLEKFYRHEALRVINRAFK